MNFISNPLIWMFRKLSEMMFKSAKKDIGYIIRIGKSILIAHEDKETKELVWKDITENLGVNPIADDLLIILEESIEKVGVPVKYRCTKCQETLVDDLDELTSYGGLGNWCKHCIAKAEEADVE